MIPAQRRNPVRAGVEGALALASTLERASRIINPIVSGARVAGAAVSEALGRRRNRRSNSAGSNMTMTVQNAPVQTGYTFGAYKISMPKACSFQGIRGVSFSGSQVFCLVRSAAATTDPSLILKDESVSGDVNGFYVVSPIRPGLANNPTTVTQHCGVMTGKDPLLTQMGVYRKWRFKKLRFVYVPKIGTNATTQIGLAWSPAFSSDTAANTAASLDTVSTLEQYECSTTFPAWTTGVLDCTKHLLADRLYFVNGSTWTAGQFSNFLSGTNMPVPSDLSPGCLLAAIDGSVANTTYGRLLMEYEIELYYRGPFIATDAASSEKPSPEPPATGPSVESKVAEQDSLVDTPVILEKDDGEPAKAMIYSSVSGKASKLSAAPHKHLQL